VMFSEAKNGLTALDLDIQIWRDDQRAATTIGRHFQRHQVDNHREVFRRTLNWETHTASSIGKYMPLHLIDLTSHLDCLGDGLAVP